MERKTNIKPFLKWAGGKGQLLSEIQKLYPAELGNKINKYAEPFIGGGAVLFDILSKFDLEAVYISDINSDLINTYKVIQTNVEELISVLDKLQSDFIPLETEDRKLYYYDRREEFNDLKLEDNISIRKAGLFIFLNKTCFNGLYRVNKSGGFNVPMGAYKNPCICDGSNLRKVSELLENVTIVCGDFKKSSEFIDDNTFAYFDPPYRPLTKTSSFISYTELEFNDESQKELAQYAELLKDRGGKVVLSNSDPKNADREDEFFDEIYSKFSILRVHANRMINSNSEKRGKITELLIQS